jgi:starch synthase (maltosyl-transferring)
MDQTFKHIIIEGVVPIVDDGRYPVKRIAGEPCIVEADIFRDGHQIIRAVVKYRRKSAECFDESPMALVDNDRWSGEFLPKQNSRYMFTIEAWTDLFASWLDDFRKKVEADHDVRSDLLEGIILLERISQRSPAAEQISLRRYISQLRAAENAFRDAL